MFLDSFYNQNAADLTISAEQGSRFAKAVSNDFNPIHDADSKRFCVPGDLLFAISLQRYGLSQEMSFTFSGMVSADTGLLFPEAPGEEFEIIDGRNKCYLQVQRSTEAVFDQDMIEQLVRSYVLFSGQNFPYILVPLMAQHNVMINPARPLAIYQSMSLHLDRLDLSQPSVELADTQMVVDGKRGDVELQFRLMDGGKLVGCGVKKIILSGLREYQQAAVDGMIADYKAWQAKF
ncbi:MAG: DUF3581 domain-containing protein [Porticoccaceae bacterium]|jgi:hypothetical protein|nr:DUF3581 domain-containing protein [Porticoccaceae bacterium]MBT5578105.1 DUF3581 domain-containing protein [Porticoccaceae bacterium]MBT7375657.1 DUF3581 domain-containing protein [Porticoccaceae bacterium]